MTTLPVLGEDQLLVFADKPGDKVAFVLDGGTKTELADMTVVASAELTETVKRPKGEWRYVSSATKSGFVESKHVVTRDQIRPSPNHELAILTPPIGCGDYCHQAVWLVRGVGARWQLSDNEVAAVIAWRGDGAAVAVDGGKGVIVVELPSGKTLADVESVMSPSYAPDGTLYVRDDNYNVLTLAGDKPTKVGKGNKPMDEELYPMGPAPVRFDGSGTWRAPEVPAKKPKKRP